MPLLLPGLPLLAGLLTVLVGEADSRPGTSTDDFRVLEEEEPMAAPPVARSQRR